MKIIRPPVLNAIPGITEDLIAEYLTEYRWKGIPYLHYDQLRHRVHGKEKLNALWERIRLARILSSQWVRCLGEVGSGILNATATIQKSCSVVDRLTSSSYYELQ